MARTESSPSHKRRRWGYFLPRCIAGAERSAHEGLAGRFPHDGLSLAGNGVRHEGISCSLRRRGLPLQRERACAIRSLSYPFLCGERSRVRQNAEAEGAAGDGCRKGGTRIQANLPRWHRLSASGGRHTFMYWHPREKPSHRGGG